MMPAASSLAVVADIHGNSWALKAVLADLRRRQVNRIVNLGDNLYGPLDPAGTADLLIGLQLVGVRGNQDRALLGPAASAPVSGSTLEFVHSALTANHRAWLASLPVTLQLDESIFLCHGTPRCDEEYLLEEVRAEGVFLRTPSLLAEEIGSVDGEVVLCAHSHVSRAVWTAGRLVVNPGSVGLPAYTDDSPFPHAMEAGSPHARYALLSRDSAQEGWRVEHVAVPYDWENAADVAACNGRMDWACWLRTGRASVV